VAEAVGLNVDKRTPPFSGKALLRNRIASVGSPRDRRAYGSTLWAPVASTPKQNPWRIVVLLKQYSPGTNSWEGINFRDELPYFSALSIRPFPISPFFTGLYFTDSRRIPSCTSKRISCIGLLFIRNSRFQRQTRASYALPAFDTENLQPRAGPARIT
jgi:hypothetical protein